MNPKEQITKIKEYADIADASYAMLHYIEENDEAEDLLDDLFNLVRKPPSRWIYADGIKRGYEVKEENKTTLVKDNHRSLGQPTAYALAIEARFSQDKEITIDNENRKIKNTIQNFIERKKEKPELKNQKIQVSTTKEKMTKDEASHYLSYRTKAFTSRYEVVEHQKNTSNGFSATLFRDCENSNQLILTCRGTEFTLEDVKIDITLAQGDIPLQCYELARFYEERIKHHLKEEEKLIVIGHSLGGYLAQSFALMYPHKVKELYTFNAPGILLDWSQSFTENVLDAIELLTWIIPLGLAGKAGWKVLSFLGARKLLASILGHSVSLKISKISFVPQELRSNKPAIQTLINNISSLKNNPNALPSFLENAKILHIETTNTLDTQKHSKTWLGENATQHLGKDIKGKYLFLYVPEGGLKSHYLDCTLKTLYFYEYLLQNQDNHSLFLKDSLQESCDALGIFTKTIYQNMYDKTIQENNEEAKRCFYSVSVSCYNSSLAMQDEILQIPNPIIAVLDKALFEGTLITKEEKQDIKKIQIFEAITYLQEHNILISVMQDNTIKAISSNSPLAYLLSIYEFLPFICTNKDSNPLIQNIQDFKSLTQRATSTKISVFSNTISEKMIEVYKNQTLLYSAETTYRGYVERASNRDERGWDSAMKLSRDGVEMLKKWEKVKNFPYDDKRPFAELLSWTEGATIGVGHLILQSEWELYKDGLNDNEIEDLLFKDIERFEKAVNKRIKTPLEQHQFDALVILAFNIGVGEGDGIDSFMNSSVAKLINGESGSNYATLEEAWLAWKKSRGKDSFGLLNRRKSEHKLYTQGIYTKRSNK